MSTLIIYCYILVTKDQLCISATIARFTVYDQVGIQSVGAVGTSNLHPEQLVLEGDYVTGAKLDLGDFKTCGSIIVWVLLLENTVFSTTPSPSTPEFTESSD